MMRGLLWIPLVVVLTAAAGYSFCVAVGWNPHPRELLFAAVACAVVSEAAIAPVILTRGAGQVAVSQAALAGTLVHLFGNVLVAAAVLLGKLPLHGSFVYWLMAFYWMTLIVLTVSLASSVRQAPAGVGHNLK